MNYTLTINSTDPADLTRVAQALNGSTGEVTGKQTPMKAAAAKPDTAAAASSASTAPTSTGQIATTAASPSEPAADMPSEKAIMDAANAAVGKLGAGGQNKIKDWIAKGFQKADGTPAGLKTVKDSQKADMVAKLNQIAAGVVSL
jgi:hypothetical protein